MFYAQEKPHNTPKIVSSESFFHTHKMALHFAVVRVIAVVSLHYIERERVGKSKENVSP